MKRAFVVGISTLILGVSSTGMAASTSAWDYASLALIVNGEVKEGPTSEDLKGYQLDVVKSLGTMAFVRAATNAQHFDQSGLKSDLATQQVGVGARFPVATGAMPIELWGSLNYERVSVAGPVGTGPGIDVGIRSQVTPQLDLNLAFKVYGDLSFGSGNDADYTGYSLSAAYRFLPNLSGVLTFSDYKLEISGGGQIDYDSIIGLGVRLHY
ncbi:MAG: hypothetical protein ACJ8LN_04170 [Sulfurifustis sp.]